VNDAGLHDSLRKDCIDGFGKALQPVDNSNQDIANTSIFQLIHDPEPELCPLGLLDPDAEDFLGSVGQDTERDVNRCSATFWMRSERQSG